MIGTFLKFLNFERIDKQFIKKIPYHLFLFIGLSFLTIYINYKWELIFFQSIFIVGLVLFLIFNTIFNHILNSYIKNYMDYAKFDKFIIQLTGILDGKFSLVSEGFDKKRVYSLFALTIFSGFSLLTFNLSLFALIFHYLKVQFGIQIILFGVLLFYIYNDVLKLDYIDK